MGNLPRNGWSIKITARGHHQPAKEYLDSSFRLGKHFVLLARQQ